MTEVAQEAPVDIAAPADKKEEDDVFGPDGSEDTTKSYSTKKCGSRRAKKASKVVSETSHAKKKGQKKPSVRESLSSDALEIISKIQQRQNEKPKAGHVSVADLMTTYREQEANTNIMHRLLQKPLTAVNVLATAASERPPVPGFPRASENVTEGVLPELLMNALNIGQNAEMRRGNRSPKHTGRPSVQDLVLPNTLPPWISLSPMYPLEEQYIHSQQRMNTSGPRRQDNRLDRSYPQHGRHEPNNGPAQVKGNTIARKPFFMAYLSGDLVSRGLASKDLIKGSLRVNQRNFEESYIDNPEGNDQMDLLIYGLQDRNRALHGDVVVVRIKQRSQWIVRENLYNAWRHNELKATCDDDGKPLTVPPVPVPKEEGIVELVLGGSAEVKIKQQQLCKPVPVNEDAKYDRSEMILMGAQAEINRRAKDAGGDNQIPMNASLSADLDEKITNLSLKRIEPQDPSLSAPSTKVQPKRPNGQKKGALRTVAEMPDEDWGMPDCCLQKTAEVVFIAEQKNCRAAMGQLKAMNDNKNWALFSPTDSRMPRMMIPGEQVPKGFFDRPQDFLKFVFVARLVEWQATNQFARGRLERSLGVAGDPDVETEGLLFSNNVDAREFPPSALQSLPDTTTEAWTIPEHELTKRRDFREETVFTIDPKTARDLDDALHIKYCDDVDGNGKPGWEVGVHIADVTYFLNEGTELDDWAAQRATSVYLVHKVIPMLPRVLCEELCSLNPGVDRLTFSVIWKIDDEGTIFSEEFVRSVIRSKVKLAYEHAQDFIEHPDKEFAYNELPEIFDSISVATIKEKVLHLNNIALKLRGQRVQNGALRLDQPKLKFALDDAGKLPMGVTVYEIKDANRLVEEYMLLANMAVARRIEEYYPSTAMLRRHPAPKQKVMREVLEICEKIGFPLDATSSGLLSSSLNKYMADNTLMRSINQVLSMLMMKPMQLAQYFCVGTMDKKSDYAHYALACPYYTHFTSPIRRYPDVIVHRFLAASLKYSQPPNMNIQEIQKLAEHCNDKKLSAKSVSEGSDEIFFGLFVKACGPLNERAVVINVLDASFDVLVFKYGVIKRVYLNKLNMAREHIHVEGPPSKLVLFWNDKDHGVLEQTIQMCTVVDVELSIESTNEPSVKYKAVIKPSTPKTLRELMLKGETLDDGSSRIPDVHPLGDLCDD